MKQEAIQVSNTHYYDERVATGLTLCKNCGNLVPKTMVCLYCGSPILFKEPQIASKF